jgi:hypothetical protein
MSRWYAFGALCALSLVAAAPRANPLDLIGRHPKPFVEPEGYFRVILPSGFDCAIRAAQDIRCQGTRGAKAELTFQVLTVPRSATPELVAFNEMQRFGKMPHFKEVSRQSSTVDGSRATTVSFSYDHQGSVERSVGVQALYVMRENKLFVIHFESRLADFARYAQDLADVYASFKPAPLDASGSPVLDALPAPAPADELEALQQKFKGRY